MERLVIGDMLGNYKIIRELGSGGMGTVYLAQHSRLESRLVAIKVLPESFSQHPERISLFDKEAKTLEGLDHPNIVRIKDYGVEKGRCYLVMEHVEGGTLAEVIKEHKSGMPLDQALFFFTRICDAVSYSHSKGVLHRDIKPANILLAGPLQAGQPLPEVKIADFGIAKILGETWLDSVTMTPTSPGAEAAREDALRVTLTPTLAAGEAGPRRDRATPGTYGYMSPEQMQRGTEMDERTDVYSLGALLFEMLTGSLPLHSEDASRINPRVPKYLDHVLRKARARKENRYKNVEQFRKAVLWRQEHPHRRRAIVAMLCIILISAGAAAWLLLRSKGSESSGVSRPVRPSVHASNTATEPAKPPVVVKPDGVPQIPPVIEYEGSGDGKTQDQAIQAAKLNAIQNAVLNYGRGKVSEPAGKWLERGVLICMPERYLTDEKSDTIKVTADGAGFHALGKITLSTSSLDKDLAALDKLAADPNWPYVEVCIVPHADNSDLSAALDSWLKDKMVAAIMQESQQDKDKIRFSVLNDNSGKKAALTLTLEYRATWRQAPGPDHLGPLYNYTFEVTQITETTSSGKNPVPIVKDFGEMKDLPLTTTPEKAAGHIKEKFIDYFSMKRGALKGAITAQIIQAATEQVIASADGK